MSKKDKGTSIFRQGHEQFHKCWEKNLKVSHMLTIVQKQRSDNVSIELLAIIHQKKDFIAMIYHSG